MALAELPMVERESGGQARLSKKREREGEKPFVSSSTPFFFTSVRDVQRRRSSPICAVTWTPPDPPTLISCLIKIL